MSLATRCPSCGTVFRVVRDQLKVSDGWVRCGRCADVFNAAQRLFELESDGAGAGPSQDAAAARRDVAPPPPQIAPDKTAEAPADDAAQRADTPPWYATDWPPPSAPASAPAPAPEPVPAPAPTWEPPPAPPRSSGVPAEAEAAAPTAPAPPAASVSEIQADAAMAAEPSAGSQREAGPEWSAAATATTNTAEAATKPAIDVPQPTEPMPPTSAEPNPSTTDAGNMVEPWVEREPVATLAGSESTASSPMAANVATVGPAATAATEATAAAPTPAHTEPAPAPAAAATPADAAGEATPEFIRRADRAARRSQPVRRGPLVALALALLLLLVGQIGIHYRDLMAATWPGTRPVLQAACSVIGCRVEAPRRIEALSVESSGFARLPGSALYRLSLVVRNKATTPVRMPDVELSLSDAQGLTVVRRVLGADELGRSTQSLPASAEVMLQATLDLGDRRVAGYTVELFYP